MPRGRSNSHHHASPPTCSVAADFGSGDGTEKWRARRFTNISQYVSIIVERACVDNNRRHHELLHADSFNVLPLLLLLLLPHAFPFVGLALCTTMFKPRAEQRLAIFVDRLCMRCSVHCVGLLLLMLETCSTQACVFMPFSSRVNFRCFQFIYSSLKLSPIIARATEMRTVTDACNSSISTRTTCSAMEEHTSSIYTTDRSIARSEHLSWCSCQAFL